MMQFGLMGSIPYRMRLPRPGRIANVVRSRLRAPLIDDATAQEVLDKYGLAATNGSENFSVGRRTDVVVITTSTGPVVVRRFVSRKDAHHVAYEHSIIRRLASVGFPVAPLLVNRQGETVTAVSGRHFAVSEFVPGASLVGWYLPSIVANRLLREAGALLARLHDELEDFRPQGRHRLGLVSAEGPPRRGPEWYLEALERLCSETPGDATERWLLERSGAIGEAIVRLHDKLAEGHLSVGVIHGDFGLHNLTFSRNGAPTVHDFAGARLDWLLIDIGKVLFRSKVASGRAFLEGYRSFRDFDAHEWAALSEVWQHYRLCGAVRSWRTHRESGRAGRLVIARSRVEEAERLARLGLDWGAWGMSAP